MNLMAREKSGTEFEPIPAGEYVAVCYGLIDLGTHHNPAFGNDMRKVLVQWEVPEARCEFERDGQKVNLPRVIAKRYTLSLSEKANLRKDLEDWRGKKFTPAELTGFDMKNILGAACQLEIKHDTKKNGWPFASIAAITPLPKGMNPPKAEIPQVFFCFGEAGEKPEIPQGLPEWVQKIVEESREWQAFAPKAPSATSTGTSQPSDQPDDDPLPF